MPGHMGTAIRQLVKYYQRRKRIKKAVMLADANIRQHMQFVMFQTPQVRNEVNRLMRYRTRLKRMLSGKSPWRDR